MTDRQVEALRLTLVYCTIAVGIIAYTKYKIAKLDWAKALRAAQMAKEASAA